VGVAREKARIRVLVIGAIHGDETSAAWLPFQWLAHVLPHANLQKQNIAVRVVPVLNPDSALATSIKRTNARGVDLNRNFPTENWKTESVNWWQTTAKRDPRRWPGKEAASEAESKLVLKEFEQYKPNVVIAVHAPFALLDFDGNGVTPPERIGSLRLDTIGIYPGSLGNYGSMVRGTPVLTLELPHAQRATGPTEARRMWNDLVAWMMKRETLLSIQTQKP
jgi:murein peptide amidase A